MKKQEHGITLILLLIIVFIALLIGGVVVNILISDGGVLRRTKETIQIEQNEIKQ
ncbi:MAG: hypothetical protein IJ777_01480 [Clostridia bacterium]|nr:hypothetical protein [Clostridia bacterium]